GDLILTEISVAYWGYSGQILRPLALGERPPRKLLRLYEVALEAYERITSAIRPGATEQDVLEAASCIHTAGYTIYDDLVHGFGGGYLSPIIRTRETSHNGVAPFTFRENMTVVVQPNVITRDETMGVQLGNLVRVTAAGCESLQSYPMRFIVIR
ncbi:MAG: M24 family metallopeptidase, partial [Dehalococcoidia bacterium]